MCKTARQIPLNFDNNGKKNKTLLKLVLLHLSFAQENRSEKKNTQLLHINYSISFDGILILIKMTGCTAFTVVRMYAMPLNNTEHQRQIFLTLNHSRILRSKGKISFSFFLYTTKRK